MTEIQLLYITINTLDSAQSLAKNIVAEKLAACVNILPSMQSIYEWEGEIEQNTEIALLCKTTQSTLPRLMEYVETRHPYGCPCMLALPIEQGYAPFMQWITEQTAEKTKNS